MAGYVELFRIEKSYPGKTGPAVIVRDFNLNIAQGEFIALIGHSGCGKSTVLSMIAGLSTPTSGAIVVANREIDGPGPDRGVVFQSPCLLPWLSAIDNVLLGVDRVFPHVSRAQRYEIAAHNLELVGLGGSLQRRAVELSQGMQQRVGIARAFAISPRMLLLDEPFGMLDSLTRMELQEVLIDLLAREQKTCLMVTHDVDEALFMADRVAMMTTGPAATIGQILDVPFERPRNRVQVLAHPNYYELREELIGFLEDQHHNPGVAPTQPAKSPDAGDSDLSDEIAVVPMHRSGNEPSRSQIEAAARLA